MNRAAVRKMAAKKGSQIQFQTDVTHEEEWNKLLEKNGLVVVDIYSEWCGPCTAMVSSLKKLKLEIGSDYLHFALAKSNSVSALQRFQNKSEPTWMFLAGGQLVNLMFGVDAPALIQLIKQELEIEMNVMEKKLERKWIPFDELTEAEKQRDAIVAKKNREKLLEEEKKLAQKMDIIRERSLLKLSQMIPSHSCIIYFPHMIGSDGTCVVAQKMMYLNDSISAAVIDQIQIQMNKTMINQVFFRCPIFNTFCETVKESLCSKLVQVTLLQIIINDEVSEIVSPRISRLEYENQTIEQKLTRIVYGSENPTNFTEQSVAYEFIVENEKGEKLPPMWTPTHSLSKAAAIEVLFPRKIECINYVPEELPPPQLIIIYDASKISDILELIKVYRNEVCRLGFFTSIDPLNAKLLCKTHDQFCNLSEEQTRNAKLVIALKKGSSDDLLLEFSQVIPTYISPNEKVGTEESEYFFPYDYDNEEEKIRQVQDKEISIDRDRENNIGIDIFELDQP